MIQKRFQLETLHSNAADKRQRWLWFRAVSGMRRTQAGKVPGAGSLNTAPIPMPEERRGKRCYQNPVGGCQGSRQPAPTLCRPILLFPAGVMNRLPESLASLSKPVRKFKRIQRVARTIDSLWSKVCVSVSLSSFISIYLTNLQN